ncbi:nitrogen regulation protein NR [Fulvivirga imtechensis AK7]|uniref:Nitrogen regulation protein NR n=1 Tax=Fulvivirga imtechensis AK7 TaxID=1237149 RepID=L8JJT5_9BACT|nr:response regulator [Fulvivirga imtechensis]ELR69070.1 nitrogen regulation protein NR [Fulvivirga imtechensis AK7]
MNLLNNIKIVIAEDDQFYAESLKKHIKNNLVNGDSNLSFDIRHYSSAKECLNNIEKGTDIMLLDYYLEDSSGQMPYSGTELLKIINSFCEDCKVIIISGQKDQDIAIQLFQIGIYEYIVKDEDTMVRLSATLRRAIRDKILDHYI